MKYKLLLALCFSYLLTKAQYVNTFFNSSSIQVDDAMILDAQGNLYGSHYMGSNVYKIGPNGNATVFKSGLNTPNGMAFDSQGFLYLVDNIGNKVYKLDSAGATISQFNVPNASGIIKSIDSDTLIVSQYGTHALRKLAPDGVLSTIPIHFGFPLNGPVGLVYGPDSSLYIGNFTDRKIFKYKSDSLHYLATVPSGSGSNLGFITFANGKLYGTSFQANKIYEIEPYYIDSTRVFAGSSAGNHDGSISIARFNNPNGILASPGGDSLYISDFATGNIRIISGLLTGLKPEKALEAKLNLFPNPSRETVHINSTKALSEILIFDLMGTLVYNHNSINLKEITINHKFKSGTYLIHLITLDERQIRKLIIIE